MGGAARAPASADGTAASKAATATSGTVHSATPLRGAVGARESSTRAASSDAVLKAAPMTSGTVPSATPFRGAIGARESSAGAASSDAVSKAAPATSGTVPSATPLRGAVGARESSAGTASSDAVVEAAPSTGDTNAPDVSVERAAMKLTSAARSSSKICGERRASTHLFDPGSVFPLKVRYYNSSWPIHGSNSNSSSSSNSSGNGSSSSSNDTTSNHDSWWEATYVGALLRPFDPGKGCQRDARRGKAVLGVDPPFDRGKARGECSMEGDGLHVEGEFLAFIWLVSRITAFLAVGLHS